MARFTKALLATTFMAGMVAFTPAGFAQNYDDQVIDNPATAYTMPTEYLRQLVQYNGSERPGTIVIDPNDRHLYLVQDNGMAIRYGIGVGREGFEWNGRANIKRKAEWPTWTPPSDMRLRQPDLPVSMVGGPDNPLGARAMYLFQGDRDTMYRIHGTNDPDSIGEAMSSGCIRMLNADVIDLYNRVGPGTPVVVLPAGTYANAPRGNGNVASANGMMPTVIAPPMNARAASLY